jgi:hypothetical protein
MAASSANTFTFWIGPERRERVERIKAAGLALNVADELREAMDAILDGLEQLANILGVA